MQVCSYRCIVSHESPQLEDFSLCILQRNNCLGNSADIPALPDPPPMSAFRGDLLTHDLAESLFIGWLGEAVSSWKFCCAAAIGNTEGGASSQGAIIGYCERHHEMPLH